MQPWKIRLSCLLVTLLAIITLNICVAEAAQKTKKPPAQLQGSAIMNEIDDGDTIPIDEGNDEEDASGVEVEETPSANSKEDSKPKENKTKNNSKNGKKEKKEKKRDKKREKLMEGFGKAEDFHKMWFNLPSTKIKTSLDKLTKFCKIACTASQCADEEVANNCHLICPSTTTKKCPDPLKKPGSKESEDSQETGESDDTADTASADASAPLVAPQSHTHVSSDVMDSINQGDNEMEGEGG